MDKHQIKINIIKDKEKEKPKIIKSINQVLLPYNEKEIYNHPWLDISTWGSPNDKGSYSRILNKANFTLFKKNDKWKYVYNKYYSDEYNSIEEILRVSFEKYGLIIRKYIRDLRETKENK